MTVVEENAQPTNPERKSPRRRRSVQLVPEHLFHLSVHSNKKKRQAQSPKQNGETQYLLYCNSMRKSSMDRSGVQPGTRFGSAAVFIPAGLQVRLW
jgi:hypothetical protein